MKSLSMWWVTLGFLVARWVFRREPVAAVYVAGAYASIGDRDQAFAWLERAYAEHPSELISLKVEPGWDPLRGDPRFQRLLERVGLAN